MSHNHTPGPWTIMGEADLHVIVIAPNGRTVANVYSANAPYPERKSIMRANARLIAAAPAMAEALRTIAEACERMKLAEVDNINPAKLARAILQQIDKGAGS